MGTHLPHVFRGRGWMRSVVALCRGCPFRSPGELWRFSLCREYPSIMKIRLAADGTSINILSSSFLHQCFPTSTLVTVRARSSSVVGAILWVSGCFTASLAWPTRSQQHTPIVTTKNVPRYCQCPFRGAQLPPVKNCKSRLSLKLPCFQGPGRSHIESRKTARWGQSPGEIQPRASPSDWGWN